MSYVYTQTALATKVTAGKLNYLHKYLIYKVIEYAPYGDGQFQI